jgi:glycosyltransferase involved in cell wall biosynthesis
MRILFLSHYFPPEVNAPANRTHEHCREWVRAGHEVHVVTCFPSHPAGVVYPGYRRRWHQEEEVDGIRVHRVWTYLAPNRGTVRRALNYLSFVPTAVWRALRLGSFDIIVATSPQFFCAVAGWLAATFKRTPWVFELRDLWPESITAVGAMKPSLPVRILEKLELAMYRHAAGVVAVTRSFVDNLEGRGISRQKMDFIPNGVDPSVWASLDREAVRQRLELDPDDFLVSYIGTVGMAHGVGTVLDAAERARAEAPHVRFLVAGDGAQRPDLQRNAVERGLDNVLFTGQVPRDEVPGLMAASDALLVLLKKSPLFLTVLPSKMFEAMAAARPIILGVEGEAREVLDRSEGGIGITPESVDGLLAAISRLDADRSEGHAMGEAGRAFVAGEFSRDVWAARMLEVLERCGGQ